MSTAAVENAVIAEGVTPPVHPRGRFAHYFEQAVAIPAAIIVLVEIVLLLTSVIFRFFLHNPIVWADELASTLFIWMGMLGSVLALQRGQHMRLTTIVTRSSPKVRPILEALAVMGPALVLALMLPHAIFYAYEESMITTPALKDRKSTRLNSSH